MIKDALINVKNDNQLIITGIDKAKDIQFKAADGSYHSTPEGLQAAQKTHDSEIQRLKSSVLGREYPNTAEGAAQMRQDEAFYWDSQKKPKEQF
jgi:hypothetical protein